MKRLFGEIFVRIIGPLHGLFMKALAYGPWGPLHSVIIRIFQRVFGIQWPDISEFKNLGEFFLRDVPLQIDPASLVSPVEARCVEGPAPLNLSVPLSVKGLRYCWEDFSEAEFSKWPSATYWNLYLAPYNYHWVHAPCSGTNLRTLRTRGKKWPVNPFGRWLCPSLYVENDRMTYLWDSPEFGRVAMICVGAMGVSSLRSVKDAGPSVTKGEKFLAFELGSTVLLAIERRPSSLKNPSVLKVGHGL